MKNPFQPIDGFKSPRFAQIPTFMRLTPQYDSPGQITALLAANLLFEFLSLVALTS